MKCSLSIHKRTNETNFHEFINSRCIDASYGKAHEAHHTAMPCGKRERASGAPIVAPRVTLTPRTE